MDKFINSLSGQLHSEGRYRMCQTYCSVLNRVVAYYGHSCPSLDVVYKESFLRGFQEHLLLDGLSRNTVAYYMTGLRSIFNFAVDAGRLHRNPNLFSFVVGGVPTQKRAVGPEVIAMLHAADLSGIPRLERCRDLFMLSLYLQGMPFTDLAHLLKSDVQGNLLAYRRRKTSGVICVSIIEPARAIIDKYVGETGNSPYLLSLLTLTGADGYCQYDSVLRRHNRQLKDLASHLGIKENLTSYVARHSWATIAYHNGVEVGIVSQAMGHHAEEVTRIYLSSFAQEQLMEANYTVLRAILRPIQEGYVEQVREEVKAEAEKELASQISTTTFENRQWKKSTFKSRSRLEESGGLEAKNVRLHVKDGR